MDDENQDDTTLWISDANQVREDGGLPFSKADIRLQARKFAKAGTSRLQHAKMLGISIEELDAILEEPAGGQGKG